VASINDYKLPDGGINWRAYREAEIACGDRCCLCQVYVTFGDTLGGPRLCHSCKSLEATVGEVSHDSHIRCPSCGHIEDITQWDCDSAEEKYEEGTHAVTCSRCEFEYEIETHVSYSYSSPPLLQSEEGQSAAKVSAEEASDGD